MKKINYFFQRIRPIIVVFFAIFLLFASTACTELAKGTNTKSTKDTSQEQIKAEIKEKPAPQTKTDSEVVEPETTAKQETKTPETTQEKSSPAVKPKTTEKPTPSATETNSEVVEPETTAKQETKTPKTTQEKSSPAVKPKTTEKPAPSSTKTNSEVVE